jgi:hypothetical protein
MDEKAMEMAIRPPHDELEDMVKVREGGIGANQKTIPDQRTDAAQSNFELIDDRQRKIRHPKILSLFSFHYLPCFLVLPPPPHALGKLWEWSPSYVKRALVKKFVAHVGIYPLGTLALRKIGALHPALGQHLAATIKTGAYSSYTPYPRLLISWQSETRADKRENLQEKGRTELCAPFDFAPHSRS